MSSPLVLLVGGRLTSGKDAFADHLVAKHGFVKLGMSDTLADALYRLNPILDTGPSATVGLWRVHPTNIWNNLKVVLTGKGNFKDWVISRGEFARYQGLVDKVGYVEAKKNLEVRRLLQALGTEVGRELLGENIWVEAAKKKILELTAAGHNVVITGIRFPNEIALEQQLNTGHIVAASVWVDRPSLPPLEAGHSSETSVGRNDFEYGLDNTGTLEDLYEAADALLSEVRADYDV